MRVRGADLTERFDTMRAISQSLPEYLRPIRETDPVNHKEAMRFAGRAPACGYRHTMLLLAAKSDRRFQQQRLAGTAILCYY
jgi:hypothetical protein